jgi:dienelactone hydrolase
MKWFNGLLLMLAVASGAHAAVIEQKVTLDEGLGSAVLYYDDALDEPTAAVIVVHEWWGMDDYTRSRAKKLAAEGYPAVAVDMYGHGKVAGHPKDAKAFMEAALAEPDLMNARFAAARALLEKQSFVDPGRIYGIGYCFGGAVVLNQARTGADLAGVASFHGSLGTQAPAVAGKVKARVLVATGGADPMIPPQQVADFVKEMSDAEVDLELLSFPGVLHGFTNPGATDKGKEYELPLAYDADADRRSWDALMHMLSN